MKENQIRANMESQVMKQKESSSSRISEIDDGSDSEEDGGGARPVEPQTGDIRKTGMFPLLEEKKCSEAETQKASGPEHE